ETKARVDVSRGLAEADHALGPKGDGAVRCPAAMEAYPRLWPACAAALKVTSLTRTGGADLSCDVLVVGGGAAGIAAATAAGREGARVVLLEHYGFLGGLATAAEVGTICGLYLRDTVHENAQPVSGGFVKEFAAAIEAAARVKPLRVDEGLW